MFENIDNSETSVVLVCMEEQVETDRMDDRRLARRKRFNQANDNNINMVLIIIKLTNDSELTNEPGRAWCENDSDSGWWTIANEKPDFSAPADRWQETILIDEWRWTRWRPNSLIEGDMRIVNERLCDHNTILTYSATINYCNLRKINDVRIFIFAFACVWDGGRQYGRGSEPLISSSMGVRRGINVWRRANLLGIEQERRSLMNQTDKNYGNYSCGLRRWLPMRNQTGGQTENGEEGKLQTGMWCAKRKKRKAINRYWWAVWMMTVMTRWAWRVLL